jgi:uncharacterized protein
MIRQVGIGFPGVAAVAIRLAWCVLASVLLSLCAALAQAQPKAPSPLQPVFPALTGRVVDTANLLDAAAEARLDGVLAAHEAATSDQVVVLTLPSLGGMAVEDFGYQLGRAWGIGQRGKDNGVLLIVSRDDRKLRIEVGYGLEGKLTDADAVGIINQTITSAFRQNDYAGGIERGVAAILQRLNPTAPMPGMADAPDDSAHRAPVIQQVQPVNHISETFIGFVAVIFGGFMVVMFLVFHGNPFRRKPVKPAALMLGASAARKDRGRKSATRASSSSSSSSRSSSSSSSSRSSRSSSKGGGGSFGGGGASGGW